MNSSVYFYGFYLICFVALMVLILLFRYIRLRRSSLRQFGTVKDELTKSREELLALQKSYDEMVQQTKQDAANPQFSGNLDLVLKKALKKAEEQNFLKNAFLANISSEIRTPLNNIIGFASLLETEMSLLENKENYEYARAISESGDRLISLLNNIIDISRIESNDLDINMKPHDINTIVTSVAQLFVFQANDQKIKFNVITNEIPAGRVDDKILTKILSAVIDNAIKYTEKGFVNVSTEYHTDTNELSIRIKDSGIGIDPSYLQDIFDPFRQESSGYVQNIQGSRLGLPISKRLIELMEGKIELNSVKGGGTTVTLYLKAAQPGEIPSTSEPLPLPEGAQETTGSTTGIKHKGLYHLDIFIVEDDLMNSIVLVEMTKNLGNVITAVNGEATLKIVADKYRQGKIFDIMLFDINLPPPYDGIKLMHEIRKRWKEYRRIPFIAQTAYAMTGDKEKLLEAGFDDYISKPINKNELYTIMKNQLAKL